MLLCSSIVYSEFYSSPLNPLPPPAKMTKHPYESIPVLCFVGTFQGGYFLFFSPFPPPSPPHFKIRILQHLFEKIKQLLVFTNMMRDCYIQCYGFQASEDKKMFSQIVSLLMIMAYKPFYWEAGWVFSEYWQRMCTSTEWVFPFQYMGSADFLNMRLWDCRMQSAGDLFGWLHCWRKLTESRSSRKDWYRLFVWK